jgi:hypothetical protein
MTDSPPFEKPEVAAAFEACPAGARDGLMALRRLIFRTAAETPGVGRLQETLKWNQPAYLTPETGAGSTLRLGVPKQGGFALYAHCRTSIIPEFREAFPDDFRYEGNRAVLFRDGERPDADALAMLVRRALTYRLRARR